MSDGASGSGGSFSAFFRQWLVVQEDYLRLLETKDGFEDDDSDGLVERVLGHYQEYYERARVAAEEDVLQFFAPPWLSALERAFLWLAGWKPGLAFRLLRQLSRPLSPPQAAAADKLAAQTRRAELELEREQAKSQERLGSPEVMDAARRNGPEAAGMKESLGKLLVAADELRMKTAGSLVEMLTPGQAAEFLAAAARVHLEMRRQGTAKDGRRGGKSAK